MYLLFYEYELTFQTLGLYPASSLSSKFSLLLLGSMSKGPSEGRVFHVPSASPGSLLITL